MNKLLRGATLSLTLILVGLLGSLSAAQADVFQTYDLAWSGAINPSPNTAAATGQITLDLTTLPNPEPTAFTDISSSITALTVTVTGAGVGNGTWTLADLNIVNWWTAGATLNMNSQLVGQPTGGNPWGTPDGYSGDFNPVFNGLYAPGACDWFTLCAWPSVGMVLTSFAPVSGVPEPGTVWLMGAGLVGLLVVSKRRGQRKNNV